ncbi:hypothetical protein [Paenisporosarcina sp. NPDC076898]|uniref:hypothetical protein n=1 Tax=unclassified Paenisporosarcina TaxID=2642018 RepID=UPI003CFD4F8C
MKKTLLIIFLSSLLFSAGFIIGTGGLGSKYSLQNIDSIQKKTIELGYTSVIDFQTVFNQIEILIAASEDNLEAAVHQFRDKQVKIMVAGLVNYKNTNRNQSEVYTTNNQSALLDEPPFLVTEQNNDSPTNKEILIKPTNTTNTLTNQQINSPKVNHSPDIKKKALE